MHAALHGFSQFTGWEQTLNVAAKAIVSRTFEGDEKLTGLAPFFLGYYSFKERKDIREQRVLHREEPSCRKTFGTYCGLKQETGWVGPSVHA